MRSTINKTTTTTKITLVDLGLAGGDTLFAAGDFTVDGGDRAMTALLAASGGRPTAVVCGNDRMALGALRALRLHGLQVPQDVSLIGYDDIEAAELSVPALTTVTVPRHELAAAACQALLAEIADPTAARGQTIRLPVTFTVRASTGPARKGG